MKNIIAVVVLTFSLLIPQLALPAELEEMFTDAYLAMLDANKLLEEKKPVEALQLYQQSLQTYQTLKAQDPEYKPENVEIRIAQISDKIATLSQELPDNQTADATDTRMVIPEEQDFKTLYFQTREAMVKDSGRLLDLEKRNIQMTVALRERQQDVEKLKQTVQNFEKQLSVNKSEQSQAHAALEKAVKDLSRFNMLLQDRADKLEMTSAQLGKQRDDLLQEGEALQSQLEDLKEQKSTLTNQLQETKRVSTLNEQTLMLTRNQLQDDLAAKGVDLGKVKAQVAELQTQIKDVSLLEETVIELNHQNETLLAQLSALKNELEASKKAESDNVTALAEMEATLNQSKSQLAQLQKEKTEWEEARKAVASLQAELEDKLETSDQRFSDLQKELAKAIKDKDLAEQERAEVLSQRGEYRDEMKAVMRENKDLQKEMGNLKKSTGKWEEEKAELLKKVETKTADMEILAQEISKLRTGLSKETVARGQMELSKNNLESKLAASETEQNRLALNLQQESDQRKLLEKNAEQQLKTITDRMNEIISLRQQISKLQAE